jgi:hypothetical protein
MSSNTIFSQSNDATSSTDSKGGNLETENPQASSQSQEQRQENSSYHELQIAEKMYNQAKEAQQKEQWNEAADLLSKSLEIRFFVNLFSFICSFIQL